MLFLSLIIGLGLGVLLYRRSLRIEGTSETAADPTVQSVHAYVDGKPVDSYVK